MYAHDKMPFPFVILCVSAYSFGSCMILLTGKNNYTYFTQNIFIIYYLYNIVIPKYVLFNVKTFLL